MMRSVDLQLTMTTPASVNVENHTELMPSRSFQHTSGETNTISQIADGGAFVNVDVSYLLDSPSAELSTSAVLHYCKRRVLTPYFRLLALLGWRRLFNVAQNEDPGYCMKIINFGYMIIVMMFVLFGYILQYAACFRKDGFHPYKNESRQLTVLGNSIVSYAPTKIYADSLDNSSKECSGSVVSVYFIPDILHFLSYLYMLHLMRAPENEQLQTLMERVFLQSTVTQAWHYGQRKLVRKLRMLLGLGFGWLMLSIASQVLHVMSNLNLSFTWMEAQAEYSRILLICIMLVCLMWSDAICVAIATSYSVYCQLIISYIQNLCGSVREKTLNFQEFVRDIQECRKFIKHLNNEQAISVSLLILNIGCLSTTAIYGILTGSSQITENAFTAVSTILTLILWVALLACPIIQAIRLTSACGSVKKLGHELRGRPFGYQDTPQDDLDSLLLYTSTLNLRAKLFHAPASSSCILLGLSVVIFVLLHLGQLHIFS